jgi:iron complex outermembrane receptor protein
MSNASIQRKFLDLLRIRTRDRMSFPKRQTQEFPRIDGRSPQIKQIRVTSLILISLTALLVIENPQIATSQTPADQLQPSDSTSPVPTEKPALPSTDNESDILLIMKEENESVSRGLGQEEPISKAPANVYVITDEDIRHSGATDIPTILRRIPGMEVMQATGADFNVSVRGNNQTAANHLLVLVDGRPIYEYAFGSVFWTMLPVTLPEIKKIEVMKGPAAAIYGFNAFDGVVNIVTKSPQEMKANTNGTLVQFGGGEFGTIRSTAIQAGTHGDFGYRLSFGHDQNQKWGNRDALALRSNKVNLHTEYALKDNSKIVLSGGLVDSNRFDGQLFDVFRESSKISNGYINAAYERPNFFIRTSWTRWDEQRLELLTPDPLNDFLKVTDRNGSIKQNFRHDVYTTWIQHALDVTATNRFTYGANYFHNAVTQVNVFDNAASENRFGLYVQDEWRATNKLTFIAGLRWDLHTELNPTYSPRLALIYQANDNHTFRMSGAVAYRPPSILETRTDLLQSFPTFGLTFRGIGSSNLNPEKIASYEMGYQGWYLQHRLRVRLGTFYNHLSDYIGAPATTSDPNTFTITNSDGQMDLYGGEAGLEFLATSWLTGFVNYSMVHLRQTSDLVAAQQFNLTRSAPPYKINAGLRGEWDSGISGEALIHYVAGTNAPVNLSYPFLASISGTSSPVNQVGAYTLVNLRGAYHFWHNKAEVAVSVFNALNAHHRENPTGEEIGSRVMGWLTLRY